MFAESRSDLAVVGQRVVNSIQREISQSRLILEENATGLEVRDALEVLLDSVYPPMPGGQARPGVILLSILLRAAAVRSVSQMSTNASSPATAGSTGRRTSKRP